ncbi:pentatricopeptide repeat-containing protein At2g36980, mitochondrial [Andrographis paniculata]|uniref:pentatricopeptide repeat-containing protein At2g36980, mitochondrial n=1 Tax=Andrographis paniculata TaxID=175694 RepID=UPI0021E84297|nr:pentatricopeptide repeat-containing protein At2g36980, mitochondrial [Andrographis paniculata]
MHPNLLRATSRIAALAKSGNITHARKVFDEMPQKDTIAWNAIITAYTHLGFHKSAISLFAAMDVTPDHFTYTAALSASAALKSVSLGRRLHGLVVVSGWSSSSPVNNALIDVYGKCSSVKEAKKVFDEMGSTRNDVSWCSLLFAYLNSGLLDTSIVVFDCMPRRVTVAWNTVIAGFAKRGEVKLCLALFREMLEDGRCGADRWTLSSVMNACGEMSEPQFGYTVHGLIVRMGWGSAAEVYNSVLSFYVRFGDKNDVLKAVEAVGVRRLGVVSRNAIIDAYMKIGDIENAYITFRSVPERNVISWTSMITGFMRNGQGECALKFFVGMTRNGIRPDEVATGGVLHACSTTAMLGFGRVVHGIVVKSGFHSDTYVGNSVVNMYAKCGDIVNSDKAFDEILDKDLVSWNTMLFALGIHGRSNEALDILRKIVASGLNPDEVTFVGLLTTCSHLGLIEEGLGIFASMATQYGISQEIDHVACVVDMLGRAGELKKAGEVVSKYVEDIDGTVKEVLFGCYARRDDLSTGCAVELSEQLRIAKPNDEMSYVVLSNLYCSTGQWKQAQALRKSMVEKGVRKIPGCSWIEIANRVTPFVAGDTASTMGGDELRSMLRVLEHETRRSTSILCFDWVLRKCSTKLLTV